MEKKVSGEVCVAIAMALALCRREDGGPHDVETTALTINRQAYANTPWSSKILTLRQIPVVKK